MRWEPTGPFSRRCNPCERGALLRCVDHTIFLGDTTATHAFNACCCLNHPCQPHHHHSRSPAHTRRQTDTAITIGEGETAHGLSSTAGKRTCRRTP